MDTADKIWVNDFVASLQHRIEALEYRERIRVTVEANKVVPHKPDFARAHRALVDVSAALYGDTELTEMACKLREKLIDKWQMR